MSVKTKDPSAFYRLKNDNEEIGGNSENIQKNRFYLLPPLSAKSEE
jgi:hypothetical protein